MKKIIIFTLIFYTSCTKKSVVYPTYDVYEKQTSLMYNICEKISGENDPVLLNKIAKAIQQARVIKCSDYFGECSQYGKFLTLAAKVSEDKVVTDIERKQLQNSLAVLQVKINKGKTELKPQ
ncbi:MAG: hypothetical protein H6625_03950 [Bdellovibrionaceae bacterium]|nr:hypothetical protein [Pseudobdellovibrionaceae bacterium]